MTIGDRIRTARARTGKTTTEIAAAVGVVARTIENWERGRGEPVLSQAPALCEALAVSLPVLVYGRERRPT